jgi:hypothetical protein
MASMRRRNQRKVQNKKETTQDLFKKETGLLFDKVKPGAGGTSKDGNRASRFFKKLLRIC